MYLPHTIVPIVARLQLLARAVGGGRAIGDVAVPLVHRAGTLWAEGKLPIAAEHLLTATLRNLLGGLIQRGAQAGRPLLLTTPAGERHEIGLLLVALLALDAGVNVVNLGVDLPAAEPLTSLCALQGPVRWAIPLDARTPRSQFAFN